MRNLGFGLTLGALLALSLGAQLTKTHKPDTPASANMNPGRYVQMLRCDNSDSIAGTNEPGTGESCAPGDYSKFLNATGYTSVCFIAHEYGGGTAELRGWSCEIDPATGSLDESPANMATAADPNPLCRNLTAAALDNGETWEGVQKGQVCIDGVALGHLVIELNDCVGDCDLTAGVRVAR